MSLAIFFMPFLFFFIGLPCWACWIYPLYLTFSSLIFHTNTFPKSLSHVSSIANDGAVSPAHFKRPWETTASYPVGIRWHSPRCPVGAHWHFPVPLESWSRVPTGWHSFHFGSWKTIPLTLRKNSQYISQIWMAGSLAIRAILERNYKFKF